MFRRNKPITRGRTKTGTESKNARVFPPALCPNEVRVQRDESVLMLRALAVTPIVGRQNSIALVPGPFPIPVFGRTRADV